MKSFLIVAFLVLITAFAFAGNVRILEPQLNSWTLTGHTTETAITAVDVGFSRNLWCSHSVSGSMPFYVQGSMDNSVFYDLIGAISSTQELQHGTTSVGFIFIRPHILNNATGSVTIKCLTDN